MKITNEISIKTLMPVFNVSGCVGHILRTAKGFRACDVNDKEIGVYAVGLAPSAGGFAVCGLGLPQQIRQLRNIHRDPSRLVPSQQLRRSGWPFLVSFPPNWSMKARAVTKSEKHHRKKN